MTAHNFPASIRQVFQLPATQPITIDWAYTDTDTSTHYAIASLAPDIKVLGRQEPSLPWELAAICTTNLNTKDRT